MNVINDNYRNYSVRDDSGYLPEHIKFKKSYYSDNSGNLVMVLYLKGEIAKSKGFYENYYYDNNKPIIASRMDISSFKEKLYFFYNTDVYLAIRLKSKDENKAITNDSDYTPRPPSYQYVKVQDTIRTSAIRLLKEFKKVN